VTFEISVLVGSGPTSVNLPDVAGQTEDQAKATLGAAGFTNVITTPVDSPKPAGGVLGSSPSAGQSVPKDTVVQLQVSKGNQFLMPDLTGMVWTDAEPQLRALGWAGILVKGADVPGSDQARNRVVFQSPSAGAGVNRDANITLKFGS
jgi:eukaryotic-like serine/threonine-protein kinase